MDPGAPSDHFSGAARVARRSPHALDVAPDGLERFPSAHAAHAVASDALENLPGGHSAHPSAAGAPAGARYVPGPPKCRGYNAHFAYVALDRKS